ncbi:LacI family DNA-binding transcriptional regulator [Acrocarpospora macrocephala]|uniref:HTH-type transcriptional regulator MalR n=1 Tax=Acrocarpospora macrocephala TaxID=150177 RepID=A0A5M3WKF5_9ACTN|nr:LacI family DNA-binding transcriptional regulator [Acrocarpospora macrocephala]GES08870.1 HTH-type transcriptional regulator MalR [Acrocarpospora macrocephala]
MKVTLTEVAARAGVSEATVSRVLNAKAGVAEDTRDLVLAAVEALGYERPFKPEAPRKSAGLVGLVVPELENPIFPSFAQVIGTLLAQQRYTPVLCTQTPGGVSEDEYVEMLLEHNTAGIIFVSGMHADTHADPSRYRRLVDRGLPIVLINGFLPGLDVLSISVDEKSAMYLAVEHLASLGHVRIGMAIGPERYVPVIRKVAGFLEAAKATLSLDLSDMVEHTTFTVEGGQVAASRLIDRGATAIICGSDIMAFGAVRAVRGLGLSVPHDVSVVGFDDSSVTVFSDPPLTTLRQPVQAMGTAAVRGLIDEIHALSPPRGEFVFRTELLARSSTGPAPSSS